LAIEEIDETKSNRIFRLLLSMKDLPRAYLFLHPSKSNKTITNVVEDAADGIIKEGISIAKEHEARWIAQQLLAVKDSGKNIMLCSETGNIPAIIGQTCIALYTRESYFYKHLNNVTRELSRITMQQVLSYGPFCYLLQGYLQEIQLNPKVTIYRGVDLSDEQREEFMKDKVIFSSFTSTSKNQQLAEWLGNTLLIIKGRVPLRHVFGPKI
jgi:hypothetical protein